MTVVLSAGGIVVDRRPQGINFVLDQDRVELGAAKALALIGPSGCGKSTLLDTLALIMRPTALEFYYLANGRGAVADLTDVCLRGSADLLAGWRGRRIGYVLQTGGLLPFATVADNIQLPRHINGLTGSAAVQEIAERLDIAGLLGRWPQDLSVGQRQRVAVARALAHQPVLLIADEPTASLDPRSADATMALLVETCVERGSALIVSMHDRDRARHFGLSTMTCIDVDGRARFAAAGAP